MKRNCKKKERKVGEENRPQENREIEVGVRVVVVVQCDCGESISVISIGLSSVSELMGKGNEPENERIGRFWI